jgi:hypothetical protein
VELGDEVPMQYSWWCKGSSEPWRQGSDAILAVVQVELGDKVPMQYSWWCEGSSEYWRQSSMSESMSASASVYPSSPHSLYVTNSSLNQSVDRLDITNLPRHTGQVYGNPFAQCQQARMTPDSYSGSRSPCSTASSSVRCVCVSDGNGSPLAHCRW